MSDLPPQSSGRAAQAGAGIFFRRAAVLVLAGLLAAPWAAQALTPMDGAPVEAFLGCLPSS